MNEIVQTQYAIEPTIKISVAHKEKIGQTLIA